MTENKSPPYSLKLLGLDIGTKRIGLAIWNPTAKLVRPLPKLDRKKLQLDLEAIRKIVEQERVEAFVVGIPHSLSGNTTESTLNAEFWVSSLKKNFELPVFTEDESLSTKEAMREMQEMGVRSKKQKVDSRAAAIILENFVRENA